jgi:hypothetical protein
MLNKMRGWKMRIKNRTITKYFLIHRTTQHLPSFPSKQDILPQLFAVQSLALLYQESAETLSGLQGVHQT